MQLAKKAPKIKWAMPKLKTRYKHWRKHLVKLIKILIRNIWWSKSKSLIDRVQRSKKWLKSFNKWRLWFPKSWLLSRNWAWLRVSRRTCSSIKSLNIWDTIHCLESFGRMLRERDKSHSIAWPEKKMIEAQLMMSSKAS